MSKFLKNTDPMSLRADRAAIQAKKQAVSVDFGNRIREHLSKNGTKSFQEVLSAVKFSKHATERIASREIRLSESDVVRIEKGLGIARAKGIRQTLIMMDNKVFIASVPNKTIITASEGSKLQEHVFTNIDGAVIV